MSLKIILQKFNLQICQLLDYPSIMNSTITLVPSPITILLFSFWIFPCTCCYT